MSRRAFNLLVIAALCWGSSFTFMKIAVDEMAPSVLMWSRCAIGAATLWLWIVASRTPRAAALSSYFQLRLVANGALTAAPFVLIAWGLTHVDSGIAGIVNASVPIWATLLALRWDAQHRTDAQRLVGVAVGFGGVVLLFATHGITVSGSHTVALASCAAGAVLYAVSGVFVREQLHALPPATVAAWSITWAALLLTLPALAQLPPRMPSGDALASVIILGVLGTGAGMLAYYELLKEAGAARASLVTYLLPPLAVISGYVLLDETIGLDALAAMALILSGVWLASRTKSRDMRQ